MRRLILPAIGLLAALWAIYSVARTQPRREPTEPPAPPPVSEFPATVAAVGLVEASTENISVGTPLPGVVMRVFVTAGQAVKAGDPLFELDLRQLRADLAVRQQAVRVARARWAVAGARLEDLRQQLEFAEQVKDRRAISAEELTRRRSAVATATAELEEAKAQVSAAESQAAASRVEIERSTVRSPIDAEVLQVKLRAGEFAPAAATSAPLILLGRSKPLHVRVDVDEHEGWRGSLTGDSTERVDTRVLQVLYRVERDDLPLFVGQQLDVFIDAQGDRRAGR
jgi:HlyD family secretion protein